MWVLSLFAFLKWVLNVFLDEYLTLLFYFAFFQQRNNELFVCIFVFYFGVPIVDVEIFRSFYFLRIVKLYCSYIYIINYRNSETFLHSHGFIYYSTLWSVNSHFFQIPQVLCNATLVTKEVMIITFFLGKQIELNHDFYKKIGIKKNPSVEKKIPIVNKRLFVVA